MRRLPHLRTLLLAGLVVASLGLPARAADGFRIDGDAPAPSTQHEPAHAPWKGEGFIGAFGAVRWVPQDDFIAQMQRLGGFETRSRDLATPGGHVPFGYVFERDWAAVIDFSYAYDAFTGRDVTSGAARNVTIGTFSLALAAQKLLDVGVPWIQPYVGGGLGIFLSTATGLDAKKPGASFETNVSGGFLSVGSRFALSGGFGVVAEVRAAIAEATLLGTGIAQVGGLTGGLGVYYAWRQ